VSSLFEATRALLEREGLAPRKRLGQHFLVDARVVERMVSFADLSADDAVLEIGPGVGALTDVLAARAGRLFLVEYDRGLCGVLRRKFADHDRVTVIEGDAVRLDLAAAVDVPLVKVVASLPYNAAVPILFRLLDARRIFTDVTVMLQREMAARLVARAGTRSYGAPSVLFQLYARLVGRFRVPSAAFYPRPQVVSEVLRVTLTPEPCVPVDDPPALVAIVRAAFGQRRKMLHNALQTVPGTAVPPGTWHDVLAAAGVDGNVRGETLDVAAFAAIANAATACLGPGVVGVVPDRAPGRVAATGGRRGTARASGRRRGAGARD
jgi:16S rRNA (adenine1518-N6/adenine1519-N6)-dimethyltransferase